MGAALFISDLHLSPAEPAVAQAFEKFLSGPARAAQSLYILGDLFEYWAGDDDLADPFNAAVCAQIAALADSGVRVYFMRGNRDFLIGDDFASTTHAVLLDDPTVITMHGERVLLMHGDTLCTDDAAYQAFRTQVRDAAWQAHFLARPLDDRKRIIMGLREQSEAAKQEKSMSIMDVNADAVHAAMRAQGVAKLIHGHTHRPARHAFTLEGRECERWVLSDWYSAPACLRCTEAGWEAVPIAG